MSRLIPKPRSTGVELEETLPAPAAGDLIYRGIGGWFRLAAGTIGTFLKSQGAAAPVWDTAGNITGPTTSNDNSLVRYDGITGRTVQHSNVLLDDSDNMSGVNNLFVDGTLDLGIAELILPEEVAAPIENGSISWNYTSKLLKIGTGTETKIFADLNSSQTLVNKSLTTPVISSISNSGTITVPTGTDTLVGKATTDILTNKTLTTPIINGGSSTGLTAFGIRSSGSGAFDIKLTNTENLTTERILNLNLNDAARNIALAGNLSLAGNLTTSGANALTLTTTGTTNVTLPESGTLITSATALGGDLSGTVGNATVTDLTIASETRGDVLYRNANNWTRLPAGVSGQFLKTLGNTADPVWDTVAGGDVVGAASSTDNAVVRFDSTTGRIIQNSTVIISDTGAITGVTNITASGAIDLSSGSLLAPQSAAAAPTVEGSLAWDTDDDLLKIGTGVATKIFVDTNSTQTLTSKTLTTPVISSISNSGTITIPTGTDTLVGKATTDILTNKTLTSPVISSISNGGAVTIPTGPETLIGRDTTDTLTNKTLTTPIISSISNSGTITLPTGNETLVGRATTDTLTNKTLTAPTVNGGSVNALTTFGIRSSGTGAFDLRVINTENLTANRNLTITANDAARIINMGGNITTAGAFITSGANSLTLTTSGTTDVTLPTSGTVLSSATSAGGDLGGTYPNPTVTDLTITNEAQGDILYRNATNWVRLAAGTSGEFLKTQGINANPIWSTISGFGDVVGAASSTDNAVVRFDSTTGKLIQNSVVIISDTGAITGVTDLTASGSTNLSTASLLLPQSNAAAPTAEGSIAWDSDDDLLKVGTGTVTKVMVDTNSSQTLTNKTLTAPIISSVSNSGTITIPTGTDTLVGKATTDILTNKTLTAPIISSISNSGTITIPTGTDTLVGRDTTDTLTNKTLTAPVIGSISNSGTITIPTGTDTLVGKATTDTLTNKTLTAPTINGGSTNALTTFGIRSSGTGAFDLRFVNTENITANRNLTISVNDAARVLNLAGNITTAANFITSGANSLTLTTSGATDVTLPTSGTVLSSATSAGGDLGGSYPNPTVTDLTITNEAQGDILYRNATNWVRLAAGTSGEFLKTQGAAANPVWATPSGSGDVTGPASSTDNAVVRFDSTTGKLLQNSVVIISDTGAITGVTDLTASGIANLSSGSLLLPQGNAAAPTAEGSIAWDSDDDLLKIGTGTVTKIIIDTNSAQTLTNKTLTSPVISSISNSGIITLPTDTDTLVGKATTDTLTNKTLTAPTVNGGSVNALTTFGVRSSGTGAFDLRLVNTENLTANKNLTITTNDAARIVNLGGDITTTGAFITSGANSLTLTTSGATNVTLPTSGTVLSSASSAGGDLGGTYPNPTVTDLTITNEAQGDILYRNATNWVRLAAGTSGHFLKTLGAAANPIWDAVSGSGDVVGPASSTDNAVARFDSTTGKLLQNSVVIISDTGAITGVTDLTTSGSANLSAASLLLPQSNAAAPTAEGSIAWDSDDDLLKVGTGTVTKVMIDTNSAQILTNKTLTSPVISSISNTGTLTLPTDTDTLVGKATVDILTNKTLTAPTVNGGSVNALTTFGVRSSGTGAFDLRLVNTENLTANKNLTITVNDTARTLNMGGNITTAGAFITSGANSLTLTTSGATDVTLPTSGTILSSITTAGGDLGGTYPSPTVVDLTITNEAHGDILYRNATNWVRLAAGNSGEFLKTQGAGANPIWATSSGSGLTFAEVATIQSLRI